MVPLAPLTKPVRNELTSENYLYIDIFPITGLSTGGAPITEYKLVVDNVEVVPDSYDGLTFKYSATSGQSYEVQYLGVNRQGPGGMSPAETIKAITVPHAPAKPVVSYADSTYTVTWSSPNTGGTGVVLTQYIVEIKKKDGYFLADADDCPGTDVSLTTCTFALDTLTTNLEMDPSGTNNYGL